jgi:soluble lytic murein transglycosylase
MKKILIILLVFANSVAALTETQNIFKKSYQKALKGDQKAVKTAKKKLKGYLLNHYLDYGLIRADISKLPIKKIESFKKQNPNSPLNESLKNMLAYELGKQGKWQDYLKHYQNSNPNSNSHCWYLNARIATKQLKGLQFAIQNTWLNGLSLPKSCDPVFAWFEKQGFLTEALIEKRILLAFEVNNSSTTRFLASKLQPKPQWVDHAIQLMKEPIKTLESSITWQDNDKNRQLVFTKSNAMASKHPDTMYPLWKKLKKHFKFPDGQIEKVDRTIALFAATDYLPFTIKAMEDLPAIKFDSQIRAWKVRYYLYHGNWKSALSTLQKMPEFQINKDHWQYWLARASAKTGHQGHAKRIFAKLAKKSNYYGFLAADHMRLPYNICSKDIASEAIDKMPIEIDIAFELFQLDMITLARKEWMLGYRKLSNPQRRSLADIAYDKGWYNKVSAIMGALGLWSNYKLRYPLAYKKDITEIANKHDVLPQWIMSIITQESAWQTDAISRADARGLMQIIDPTAKRLSKQLGVNYTGKQQLHQARFNLELGIFYQRILLDQFNDHPLLALASYNAGERKAEDWLDGFPKQPDIWAETIPYRETRGYITKILTNITIYDWLINKHPRRISSWMPTFPVNAAAMKKWPNKTVSKQTTVVECHQ